jgi:hypothetical protein
MVMVSWGRIMWCKYDEEDDNEQINIYILVERNEIQNGKQTIG